MDTDLLTVARTLAERGWLPGLSLESTSCDEPGHDEAVFHLAAHNEIVRRGWKYTVGRLTTSIWETEYTVPMGAEDGTTTLSLLRCLRAACEAAERNEGVKR